MQSIKQFTDDIFGALLWGVFVLAGSWGMLEWCLRGYISKARYLGIVALIVFASWLVGWLAGVFLQARLLPFALPLGAIGGVIVSWGRYSGGGGTFRD